MGINTVSPTSLIVYLYEDKVLQTVIQAERTGNEARVVECSLTVGEIKIPCVLMHTRLDDVHETLETRLSEGVIVSVNATTMVLEEDTEQLNFHIVDPTHYEWEESNEESYFVVVDDDISFLEGRMYKCSLRMYQQVYPRVTWHGTHILLESGVFSVGIIDGKVEKNHLLFNGNTDVSSILLSFREMDEHDQTM